MQSKCSRSQRVAAPRRRSPTAVDLDVAVADQLDDASALRLVVLDDQQALDRAARRSS